MKFCETNFDEYLTSNEKQSLHPVLQKNYKKLPDDFSKMNNMILYGPKGCGKYTQSLCIMKKYSPSNLKYEKRLMVLYNKVQYFYKISDIHYEVDIELLGCNSKLLWHEIFTIITDSINAKKEKNGIILCKNFHTIHNELLEVFYSYMQTFKSVNTIKFILLTEHVGFIPSNIISFCEMISFPKPAKSNLIKCFKQSSLTNTKIEDITNLKDLKVQNEQINTNKIVCKKIIEQMENYEELKYSDFREQIYDIFIYNLDVSECIYEILNSLIQKKKIKKLDEILKKTYNFFKYYNNNYRPIYHLENYLFYLISIINEI